MENLLAEFEKLSAEDRKTLRDAINSRVGGEMKGKVAIVTGGNRGMGKSIVEKLAAGGATIVFTSSAFNQKAKDFEAHITQTYGVECIYIPADCRKEDELNAMVDEVANKFGRIDILVNNAGRAYITMLTDTSTEDFNECIAINLTAPFITSKRVVPHMIKNKWGRIVNITSNTTIKAQKCLSAYMAAKSGLNLLTRGLALEVAEHGITVNNVLPGPTDTDMVSDGINILASALETDKEHAIGHFIQTNAIKRLVYPEDIGDIVYYLCREEARSITGVNYSCDCGFGI